MSIAVPEPVTARRPRAFDVAAVALLVAACGLPAVGSIVRPEATENSVRDERRAPASWPGMPRSAREAARWPRLFKSWHDDQLGFRDVVLEARSRLLLHGMGISPTASALIDDGWLFYAAESSVEAWRGAAPLAREHVDDWVRVFRDRTGWCGARGIVYRATLAPNKYEVYPERVPAPHAKIGPSRYDQIHDALSAERGGWYVDMRSVLIDERRHDAVDDYTYSRSGTHWTARAALRGCVALLESARSVGFDVEIPRREHFRFAPFSFDDDAWRGQLHLPDYPLETQPLLVGNLGRAWRPTERLDDQRKRVETMTGDKTLPRLWLVHDSFGMAVRPMLAPYFSRVTCDWKVLGEFDPEAMRAFAPHLVIDLHTERQVYRSLPDFIASRDAAERAKRFQRAGVVAWSLPQSAARVRTEGRITAEHVGDELVLESSEAGGAIVIADARLRVRGTPILRLELDAEHAGPLHVQWQLRGGTTWRTAQVREVELAAGPQEVLVEILDPDARDGLRIGVPASLGRVRLRAAEVRSANW